MTSSARLQPEADSTRAGLSHTLDELRNSVTTAALTNGAMTFAKEGSATIARAAIAGKVAVRSGVVVKMTLAMSSVSRSFRRTTIRNISVVASRISSAVLAGVVVAPRIPRQTMARSAVMRSFPLCAAAFPSRVVALRPACQTPATWLATPAGPVLAAE